MSHASILSAEDLNEESQNFVVKLEKNTQKKALRHLFGRPKIKDMRAIYTLLFGLSIFASCTKIDSKNDPQQSLKEYITYSFSVKDLKDKDKLLSYLTGPAKTRLTAWSKDQFEEAFMDHKKQFVKLAVREIKKVSDQQTDITYELVFNDQMKDKEARVTNKRLAEIVLENGKWLIKEVRNIKELIEYKNELVLDVPR
jgi:hypothetical protein